MLRFIACANYFFGGWDNLNTSHVKVYQVESLLNEYGVEDLNTSHVKVYQINWF